MLHDVGELKRIPNQITCLRIVLTAALYWLVDGDRRIFLAVFLAAGATDVLDGYVARKLGDASAFGPLFDSLADGFLVGTGTWCLWKLRPEVFTEHAGLWLFLAVCLAIPHMVALIRLRRYAGFHLYTAKATYLIAFFGYGWVVWAGYVPFIHYLFAAGVVLKSLEATAVGLLVADPYSDLRPSLLLYRRTP